MGPNLTEQRQQAHSLLDVLPDKNLPAVCSLLEEMVEPLSRSLAMAPVEEEDLTEETVAALEGARKSLDAGLSISHEEILREIRPVSVESGPERLYLRALKWYWYVTPHKAARARQT